MPRAPRRIEGMAQADATGHDARFPARRPRRLRRTPALRRLVAEARLGVDDLVAPLFVREAWGASADGIVAELVGHFGPGGDDAP